jgi:hypothetical protein
MIDTTMIRLTNILLVQNEAGKTRLRTFLQTFLQQAFQKKFMLLVMHTAIRYGSF